MKKYLFSSILIFLYSSLVICQNCIEPNETLVLSSQSEVDNFSINYPNCIEISGNLTIEGNDITSLVGLNSLTRVGGVLLIQENNILENLNGLNNISIVQNLNIKDNETLKSLNGLNSLSVISQSFRLENNNSLVNLEGLDNLFITNSSFLIFSNDSLINLNGLLKSELSFNNAVISILSNNSLESLDGLNNLTEVGSLFFIDNASLNSLSALENLTEIVFDLKVEGNSQLKTLDGLNNLTTIGGSLRLYDTQLENVEALNGVTSLSILRPNSELSIQNNAFIKNLKGLENVTALNRINAVNNNNLESFEGLENVTTIASFSTIKNNNLLINLTGLDNVNHLGTLIVTENDQLNNLGGLNKLTSINWDLTIENNISLVSLEGLNNLDSIGIGLDIIANPSLKNLQGLSSLSSVEGSLIIDSNGSLENLQGLENLLSIGFSFDLTNNNSLHNLKGLDNLEFVNDYFEISNNDLLTRLEGLENLSFVNGALRIKDNNILRDITQISKVFQFYLDEDLDSNATFVTISSNPELSTCASSSLCAFINKFSNNISINNNGDNCNSKSQILNACEDLEGKVNVLVFNDTNGDGVFDNHENLIYGIPIIAEPLGIEVLSNGDNGAVISFLEDGDYIFSYDQENVGERWSLTSEFSTYQISINNENKCDTIEFGLQAIPFSELNTNTSSGPARCNEYVPFYINVLNTGTTTASGFVWLDLDESVEDYTFISNNEPDSIIQNRLGWYFENLDAGERFKNKIELLMPGPPSFELGNELLFETIITFEDELGSYTESTVFTTPVLCSWDPNDKLVQPARNGNYTLFEENLFYTIRFQNTGNAEAYHVSVKDTLDINLNPRTFRVVDSSHPDKLTTVIENNRFVSFNFDYIYLPDSTSNPEGSQGYVTYAIDSHEGVEENTTIENTASIFFDSNPPIVTNTTENLMVSCLPFSESFVEVIISEGESYSLPDGSIVSEPGVYITEVIDEDCVIELITTSIEILTSAENSFLEQLTLVSPNPSHGIFNVMIKGNETIDYLAILYDFSGHQVFQQDLLSNSTLINASRLPKGIYALQVKNRSGKILVHRKVVMF